MTTGELKCWNFPHGEIRRRIMQAPIAAHNQICIDVGSHGVWLTHCRKTQKLRGETKKWNEGKIVSVSVVRDYPLSPHRWPVVITYTLKCKKRLSKSHFFGDLFGLDGLGEAKHPTKIKLATSITSSSAIAITHLTWAKKKNVHGWWSNFGNVESKDKPTRSARCWWRAGNADYTSSADGTCQSADNVRRRKHLARPGNVTLPTLASTASALLPNSPLSVSKIVNALSS